MSCEHVSLELRLKASETVGSVLCISVTFTVMETRQSLIRDRQTEILPSRSGQPVGVDLSEFNQ